MNLQFSDRMAGVKGSAIREIFKATTNPNMISFAGGNPSPDTFPVEELKELSRKILTENPSLYLQYGVTEGYAPLVEIIKDRLSKQNIVHNDDKLIILSGAQQGLDLAAKALLNKGDGVICEAPSFIGALNAFRTYEANLYGVEVVEGGIDTEKLEKTLEENKNIKILYVIPTFQNPSGATMSLESRKKVLELCKKNNVVIFEDNPYGELKFTDEEVPTIKSLDKEGETVLYVGSLSKVLAPGLRIGFVCGNSKLIEKMVILKQVNDVHTNLFSQALAYEWLKNYSFDEHVKSIRALYKHKCELMLKTMDETFPSYVTYTRPKGGIFIWCDINRDVDMKLLTKKALDRMVAFVPGNTFMTDIEAKTTSFRLNYSTSSDEKIVEGINILAEVLKEI